MKYIHPWLSLRLPFFLNTRTEALEDCCLKKHINEQPHLDMGQLSCLAIKTIIRVSVTVKRQTMA